MSAAKLEKEISERSKKIVTLHSCTVQIPRGWMQNSTTKARLPGGCSAEDVRRRYLHDSAQVRMQTDRACAASLSSAGKKRGTLAVVTDSWNALQLHRLELLFPAQPGSRVPTEMEAVLCLGRSMFGNDVVY